jgi:hypothetical protein
MAAGVAAALVAAGPARAQEISLEEVAAVEREERAALEKVEAAHGNKPPRELPSQERAQIIHEQQEATRSVLERRSIDPKAFAARVMRLSPAERAQVDAEKAKRDQEERERREREEAAAASEPEEVEVIRGIDEKHPVDLYRDPDEVEVEYLTEGGEADEAPAAKPQKGHQAAPAQKSSRGNKSRHK